MYPIVCSELKINHRNLLISEEFVVFYVNFRIASKYYQNYKMLIESQLFRSTFN